MTSQTLVANTAAKSAANTGAAAILRASQSGASVKITAPASEVAALSAADARLAAAQRGEWYILAASAVQVTHTGSASETTLATVTIPGGAMGANGAVRVTALFSHNNDASLKTLRIKFGGTNYLDSAPSAALSNYQLRTIWNRNSASSQVGGSAVAGSGFGSSTGAIVTSAVNTANDVTLLITGQLADSADNVALESYLVEVYYKA